MGLFFSSGVDEPLSPLPPDRTDSERFFSTAGRSGRSGEVGEVGEAGEVSGMGSVSSCSITTIPLEVICVFRSILRCGKSPRVVEICCRTAGLLQNRPSAPIVTEAISRKHALIDTSQNIEHQI